MAVPKKRQSPSRKGKRHAGQHHKLYAKSVAKDATTGEIVRSHRISPDGTYRGMKIFMTKADRKALLEGQTQEA